METSLSGHSVVIVKKEEEERGTPGLTDIYGALAAGAGRS